MRYDFDILELNSDGLVHVKIADKYENKKDKTTLFITIGHDWLNEPLAGIVSAAIIGKLSPRPYISIESDIADFGNNTKLITLENMWVRVETDGTEIILRPIPLEIDEVDRLDISTNSRDRYTTITGTIIHNPIELED